MQPGLPICRTPTSAPIAPQTWGCPDFPQIKTLPLASCPKMYRPVGLLQDCPATALLSILGTGSALASGAALMAAAAMAAAANGAFMVHIPGLLGMTCGDPVTLIGENVPRTRFTKVPTSNAAMAQHASATERREYGRQTWDVGVGHHRRTVAPGRNTARSSQRRGRRGTRSRLCRCGRSWQ